MSQIVSKLFFNYTQIEFVAYKKFRTEYRPFMIRFKVDLCDFVKAKNHPYFRFIENVNDGKNNMLDPCPYKVKFFPFIYHTWLNFRKNIYTSRITDSSSRFIQRSTLTCLCFQLEFGDATLP